MKRLSLVLVLLGSLIGCGYSEDDFADDFSAAFCDNIMSCEADIVAAYTEMGLDEATAQSTYDTAMDAACATADTTGGTTDGTDNCDFDSAAAKDCVDEVKAMSCDFWSTGTGFPEVCNTVCG